MMLRCAKILFYNSNVELCGVIPNNSLKTSNAKNNSVVI